MGKVEAIVVVILIILLLFGSRKIPELARNLGKSGKEIKKGFKEGDDSSKSKSKDSDK